jgi:succinate dehydrogenase flavin-adding protein (antitoxin of CptAB toxin-antitoxin module)
MLVPNIAVHDEIKITGIEFGEGIQIESIPHDDLITLAPDAELPKKFVASIGREAFAIKTLFSDEEFSELAPKHKFYCPREIRVHGRRSQLGTHLALYVIADQVYFQGYARTIPNEKVSSVRCGIGRGGISDFVDRHGNFQDRNDFVVGNGLGAMVAIVAVEFADDAPIGRSPYVIVVRKGIRYPDDIWLSNKTNKPITSADNDDISRARFVFQSRQLDFGSTDIYAADFNGSNMVNLTDDNPEAYDGFFDDNGDEIVAWINNNTIRYSSMRDGQREVIEKVDPGAATQGTK